MKNFRPALRATSLVLGLAWGFMIHQLSSMPIEPRPVPFLMGVIWNGGHAAIFAVLSLLILLGLPPRMWPAGVVLCVLYGGFDEWHQASVPGRTSSFTDWITDTCGVFLGLMVVLLLRSRRRKELLGLLAVGSCCLVSALVAAFE